MPFQGNTDWAREALGIIGGKKPAAKKGRARKALKITPGAVRYVKKIEPRNLPKLTPTQQITGLALAAYKSRAAKIAVKRGLLKLGTAAAAGSRVAGAGIYGAVALAGVLAHFITAYVLDAPNRARATLQENAARASDAYRAARLKIAQDQGRALTKTQQKQLAGFYKAELQKLGLDQQHLEGLTGKSGVIRTTRAGYVPRTKDG